MGWLFIKKHPAIVEAGKKLNYDDLANDSLVVFQKKTGKEDRSYLFCFFQDYHFDSPTFFNRPIMLLRILISLNIYFLFLDPWFALFMCFVFPGLVCTLWGDNFWNGYWVAGGLRYIVVLHFTW
jgi:stearoyl-CoA desaturase (delta-9 desaturase)